jgi:hypothetical protein
MKAKLWQPAIRQLEAVIVADSAFAPARDALAEARRAAEP